MIGPKFSERLHPEDVTPENVDRAVAQIAEDLKYMRGVEEVAAAVVACLRNVTAAAATGTTATYEDPVLPMPRADYVREGVAPADDLSTYQDVREVHAAVEEFLSGFEWETPLARVYAQSEAENAAWYLVNEDCWRVEYNVRWGQNEKVSWVEATDEAEARGDESRLPTLGPPYGGTEPRTQVRVLSARRATLTDLREFIESDPDLLGLITGSKG